MIVSQDKDICFSLFVVIWNQRQGQTTPDVHFRIAEWLENAWTHKKRRLLLMAFRACGKSTLVGLFAAWLLFRHSHLRILVLAADYILARKMVRNVKRIIEKHPATKHMKPDKADQWANDRFTVNRKRELRDPSMMAKGITSNITGSRADIIICDDVEVPNTCATFEKRSDLRHKLSETDFVRVPKGTQLYVGTPHTYYSIYAATAPLNAEDDNPFLDGYERLEIPLLNKKGHSNWPDRFDMDEIQRIKTSTGPNKFASQMMLRPVNIAEGRLDPENLKFYRDNIEYSEAHSKPVLTIGGIKMVSASAWWDPSFGRVTSDRSVVAVIFSDANGGYWAHDLLYIDPHEQHTSQDDEATYQCRQIAAFIQRHYVPSLTIEINGIGRFLPGILRRELRSANISCAVKEASSNKPKDQRIIEAFDAILAAQALHLHEDILRTPFMTEMREWKPGRSQSRDDGLDAMAGAILSEPVRITSSSLISMKANWTAGSQTHKAHTEFEV